VFIGRKNRKNTPSIKTQKLLETSQELSMAAQPVDTETKLSKMNLNIMMDNHSLPMGPSGITDKITITENTKVLPQVDYCVSDIDLKATEAVSEHLYFKGNVPESTIKRIFSAGLLGEEKNRRIVPTRWTITAVDDIISKGLIKEIKKFPEIDDYQIFEATYLDNHFKILLFPGKFMYEMNEVWAPNTLWNISLDGSNRSLIFREVSGGYVVPLGVWVIRETVNNAMWTSEPIKLDNFNDAINKMTEGFIVQFKHWKKSSKLINYIKTQSTIDKFL
jgi:hypothetical protein